MRKEAENWFKQAKADLKTARDCLRTENYYACAFFSQQSLEKALKAWFLIEKQETPSKTHNLLDLSLELNIPEERPLNYMTTAPPRVYWRRRRGFLHGFWVTRKGRQPQGQ